jgi:tripartite-type tricarboxylate transporter receptor subunit TctC
MQRKALGNLVIISLVGLSILLYQSINMASAKDPDYPTKPITFIISFGAGGTIAAAAVMGAKPDGYTLGTILTSAAFVAPFSGEAPYKDLSAFTMIANYGNNVYPLMVMNDAPWNTWKEFIEWARKNPRGAKIAITGARSVASQGPRPMAS